MTPRKRYTFWIEGAQVDALNRIRERDGVLPSEQIRRALDEWFKKKGILKTGRKRAAARKRP